MHGPKHLGPRSVQILTIALAAMAFVQCTRPAPSPEPVAVMPNPASVYCEAHGGRIEIRTDALGNEYGVCIFPDGSECEEWAFYRGACAPGRPPSPVDTSTPPSTIVPPDTATPTAGEAPAPATPTPRPEQIIISRTSVTVQGELAAGGSHGFTLFGRQSQRIMVDVSSPNENVFIEVRGAEDGEILVAVEAQTTSWVAQLAATQPYIIQVIAIGQPADYVLTVVVPEGIQFESDETSAVIQGRVNANQVVDYVLLGRQGQFMTVVLVSPEGNVHLTIFGLNDSDPLVRAADGATQWEGTLPATQDYVIQAVAGAQPSNYTLTVTIR